jgi:predicted DNA-binding transcriptional regulator AlpA
VEPDSPVSLDDLTLIQAAAVKRLLGGVSDMWLYRHRHELPRPVQIGGRRFWRRDEIVARINELFADRQEGGTI